MFRTITRLAPSLGISIFNKSGGGGPYDQDLINRPNVKPPETGWERVKLMYTGNEYEQMSPELNTVLQSALCGAFIGACMGGFSTSRVAYLNFIENNQATIFKSTGEAKKKLQDYVTVAFAKGAYKWGWRLSFFTGIFSLASTTVSVYRGETSLIEFVSAGALTGALYKLNLGLAATVVGALIGTVLSGVAGFTIIGILKITGLSMDDIRKALYRIKEARDDQYNQVLEKSATIKNDEMSEHHKQFIAEIGERKIEEIK